MNYEIRGTARWGLGVFLVILWLFLIASPVLANLNGEKESLDKEAILKEARALIDMNQPNPKDLRQAITILEGNGPRFPREVRFPLYLAEAYYRLADPGADVARELPYYEKTEMYAKRVLQLDPKRTEGHYWLGLAWLKKAQKGGIRAYFIVKDGIKELEKVRSALPAYDHAGASRVLGLLYSLAPAWTPFGNLHKAIELGKESTRIAPDYVLNRLYLADAYKKLGDKEAAVREYRAILIASAKMPGAEGEGYRQKARTMLSSLGCPM
jgi:tetratricopeptide (TPR) repeat protein